MDVNGTWSHMFMWNYLVGHENWFLTGSDERLSPVCAHLGKQMSLEFSLLIIEVCKTQGLFRICFARCRAMHLEWRTISVQKSPQGLGCWQILAGCDLMRCVGFFFSTESQRDVFRISSTETLHAKTFLILQKRDLVRASSGSSCRDPL